MRCDRFFETIDMLNDRYISVWEDVCNIESPTADKMRVDEVGEYFIRLAGEKGWQAEKMELANAGNPICITLNPDAQGEMVVFSGHIDTVHPVGIFGTPAVRRDDTCIYGPGVIDCKGGVVASFMAMDALERCGFDKRPVRLIIQTDEETGSKTSGKQTVAYMIEKSKGAIAFLNAEGIDGNSAVIGRKGILRMRLIVRGRSAHSAWLEKGANAIAEAAHKIISLEKMKDPRGLTCNCGLIQGGTVANTVPDECSFVADIRFADPEQHEEALRILEETAAHSEIEGCTCALEQVSYRPSMPLVERNELLYERMNEIFVENGLPTLGVRISRGGSDAAYITEAGIPCVDSVGVEGGGVHSPGEFAYIASLAECAKRLAAITVNR